MEEYQLTRLIIKTIITLAATEHAGGEPLFKAGIFGAVYAIMTYYAWYLDKRGGFFGFIRKNGLSESLVSIAYLIFSPLVPLTAIALIINTGEMGEASGTFISVL